MDNFDQALNYAKQNPDSPYAAELRKRIEAGEYNQQLQARGVDVAQKGYGIQKTEPAPQPAAPQTISQRLTGALDSTLNPITVGKGMFGAAKMVGNALTSNTQKFGQSIGTALQENLPATAKPLQEARATANAADTQRQDTLRNIIKNIPRLKAEGKDTTFLENMVKGEMEKGGIDQKDLYGESVFKTGGQIAGEALGTLGETLSWGKLGGAGLKTFELGKLAAPGAAVVAPTLKSIALQTGKNVAEFGGLGYGFDVAQNLQEGKTGGEAFKPGLGTALGAGIPGAIGLVQAAALGRQPLARAIESTLIKPAGKDIRFGKDPAGVAAEMIKPANNWDDYFRNAKSATNQVGRQIGETADLIQSRTGATLSIDTSKEFGAFDDLIKKAAASGDDALLKRANDARNALLNNMIPEIDEAGNYTGKIVSGGARKLEQMTIPEVLELKRTLGDMVGKWTNNPAVDKPFDQAARQVYGQLARKIESAALAADPELGAKFVQLNDKYGSLISATAAIDRQANKAATASGMFGGFGTQVRGGLAAGLGAILGGPIGATAGLAEIAIEKASKSPAIMSRLASFLAGQPAEKVAEFYAKNPEIQSAIYKIFQEPNMSVDDAIKSWAKRAGETLSDRTGAINLGAEIGGSPKQTASYFKDLQQQAIKAIQDFKPSSPLDFQGQVELEDLAKTLKQEKPSEALSQKAIQQAWEDIKRITGKEPQPPKAPAEATAKTADPLLEEAKKYKSAEEFVKAQTPAYHGSPVPLKRFSDKKGGVFFTEEYSDATGFAGSPDNVYEGYLNFKKPLVIDANGAKWNQLDTKYGESTQEVVSRAQKDGYDGIVFKNIVDNVMDDAEVGTPGTIYYAYKPQDAFINESQLTDIWKKAHNK